ncbi:melanoma-associated antigen B4-like [Elephas maximus indicus]|uniref:melanoma-associated antigen B4-like n=1 Tax=Elephas maximus indicus TaxID=99487 RepID=UPI00211627E9|nr:melanoma-associated antigen B4-like [Elephas maximus indicus]
MPHDHNGDVQVFENLSKAQGETQVLKGPQATLAEEGEPPSSSSLSFGGAPLRTQSLSAAGSISTPQEPQRALSTTTATSGTRSDEGANSQNAEGPSTSQAPASTKRSCRDPLTKRAGLLEQFLLYKYKMKQPITKADMLKIVKQKYKDQFPEILKRAAERIEIVFAADVKEVDPITQSYALVSKMDLPNDGRVCGRKGLPKTGLLMTLLGVIFLKGNRATEEEIWEFLKTMRVFAGKKHFIYGEPRKLITKDLVKLKYLEYRQVPNSDPPSYEFLWGPRAHAETTKMKVLEFLAKINDTDPSAFASRYEEALRDEEERAQAIDAARAGSSAMASAYSRASAATANTPSEI